MGWYFRKSFRSGPFRINLSKSGIGYSFGIKGARISTGPRGTYVNFGANGIYYRKKISPNNEQNYRRTPVYQPPTNFDTTKHTITSGLIDTLTDTDSKEFIDELTEKSQKISYLNWFGITPTIIFFIIMVSLNFDKSSFLFLTFFFLGLGALLYLCSFLHKKDKERLTIEIHYVIDNNVKEVYTKFIQFFNEITLSSKCWQYLHAEKTNNYKYHSGANNIINRIPINSISPDKKPLKFFKTNIQIPNIQLRNTDLYFFPERLVIKRDDKYAAVFYKNLTIGASTSRFIESEGVPSDSKIVDYTWRYLNKNGTPDRRFNNNHQIPICLYSLYVIESETGVYEIISTSKVGAFDNFAKIIGAISELQKRMGKNLL